MKQECFFDIKDNSLYFKSSGKKLSLDSVCKFDCSAIAVEITAGEDFLKNASQSAADGGKNFVMEIIVPLSSVVLKDGGYDENLLANLRTFLKKLEENGSWAIISPSADFSRDNVTEEIIDATYHTTRRVKDCQSVIGVKIPDEFSGQDANALTESLSKKHAHYIYFGKDLAIRQ